MIFANCQIEISAGIKETLDKIEKIFLVKYFELKMQDLIFDAAGFRLQIENYFPKLKIRQAMKILSMQLKFLFRKSI